MIYMIELTTYQYILSIIAGSIVGFSLGLIGGGGSILAVPLLLYFVGLGFIAPPGTQTASYIDHLVIGTTALAVGINAYANSYLHYRKGNVRTKEGITFALPGVVGSLLGASIGLSVGGPYLLILFGFLMIGIGVNMLRGKEQINSSISSNGTTIRKIKYGRIIPTGFVVGLLSGFFGIGGGFLIVPGLIYSAGLNMIQAVGTSLISVGTFGVVSALRYAIAGDINVIVALLYFIGGVLGGYAGTRVATSLPRITLRRIFSVIIIIVAVYLIYENVFVLL
ncbi:anion permease [Sulfolobales archaeon HS-7]|nr:anion permease [Sulfolobales archaeon HS-7]